MTTIAKRLVPGSVLTGTASTYYSPAANTRAVIKSATLVNTTAGAVACTVYVVPAAGTAGAANAVISARSIAVNESYSCPELINHVLSASESIQAFGNGVTLMVSGAEIV